MLDGCEHRVIRASDIALGALRHRHEVVSTKKARTLLIDGLPFLVREKFLVCILRRALQGNLIIIGPDTL
jgi:hypothetical protein